MLYPFCTALVLQSSHIPLQQASEAEFMTSLKYQPPKASEAYYQIRLFFFFQFAEMVNTHFFLWVWGDGICGEFCLFNGGHYFGKV